MKRNLLILGDNLNYMRRMKDETVDLIYLDPQFNSNENYVITDNEGEMAGFSDIWRGGTETYIEFLFERLIEMKRILKSTGSIFLHCDYRESHYIKVRLLDKIFGRNRLINEIVWCYSRAGSKKARQLPRTHDTIFWYSKGDKWTFNPDEIRIPYSDYARSIEGKRWKQHKKGDFISRGTAKFHPKGKVPETWWVDIGQAFKSSKERTGYRTQKPLKLLNRIIRMASNLGDVVFDPFMGTGTTCESAYNNGRLYIGIDSQAKAFSITLERLKNLPFLMFSTTVKDIEIIKNSFEHSDLVNMDAHEFADMMILKMGGVPNTMRSHDMGFDGYIIEKNGQRAIIQSKRSISNIGRNVIDNFATAIRREKVKKGYVVGFSFSSTAETEAARTRRDESIDIHLKLVSDIVELNMPIDLSLTYSSGKVKANSHSLNGSVVNHVWWFDLNKDPKPVVLYDDKGEQDFSDLLDGKPHTITCKVMDEKGSVATESIVIQ